MQPINKPKTPAIYIYQLSNTIAQSGISLWGGEKERALACIVQANREIQLFFPDNQEFQEIVNSKLAEMGLGVKVETLSELPLIHHPCPLHHLPLLCQYKIGQISKSICINQEPSSKNLAQLVLFLMILYTKLIENSQDT